MCVPELTCLVSTVWKILKEVRKFKCKSRDSGHAPFGINASVLVSNDLINKYAKFEACSFSLSGKEKFQMIWSVARFLCKPRPLKVPLTLPVRTGRCRCVYQI